MNATLPYTCEKHLIPDLESWCPQCVDEFEQRRPASDMTTVERVQELRNASGQLTIPFNDIHQRIEELVGRGVYTHELSTEGFADLIAEVESGQTATFGDILGKLPSDKPVIVVGVQK